MNQIYRNNQRSRRSGRGAGSGRKAAGGFSLAGLSPRALLLGGLVLAVLIIGIIIAIVKYAPSREWMELTDYFTYSREDEAAVILNGTYTEPEDGAVNALVVNDFPYIEISYLKENLDEGYVYDSTEQVLRYTTDSQVVSANLGSSEYTVGRDSASVSSAVVYSEGSSVYLSLEFVSQYTDITYSLNTEPNRLVIWTAGTERTLSSAKKVTQLRRYGGPKSKILDETEKGESLYVIENYGKWSLVLTEDGVLGCIKNRYLGDSTEEEVAANLEERVYNHILMDEKVNLLWHQVTNTTANSSISSVLEASDGINVISPTWFYLNDNQGGIANIASLDYVTTAHNAGVQVWGLISNLENSDVDTTTVLSVTSARDNLINNIVAAAIAYDLDGINVDFESLSSSAADGYMEFIRELSLKCESNDLVLSVDNYVPSSSTMFYNRANQALYADYVIVMAYDEHYRGSEEAGSTASIGFVTDGITDTLEEVPAEQVILGMPFYTRIWSTDGETLNCESIGMKNIDEYLSDKDATITWLEDEGQNYAEFTLDGLTYMIWIEDTQSLTLKLSAMQENSLAGGAFWKSGFETEEIWSVIATYMN